VGFEAQKLLFVRRWHANQELAMVFNFGDHPATVTLPLPAGKWYKLLDTTDARWQPAPDSPPAAALPDQIQSADMLTIQPETVALFDQMA
jgi:hypothetical protein